MRRIVLFACTAAALAACATPSGSGSPGLPEPVAHVEAEGVMTARAEGAVVVDGSRVPVDDVRVRALVDDADGELRGSGIVALGEDSLSFELNGTNADGRIALRVVAPACGQELTFEISGVVRAEDALTTSPQDVEFECRGRRIEAVVPALDVQMTEWR